MIDRYQCFTGHDATNYDATETDDGPWVSYEDHSDVIQRLLQHSHSRERMNSRTIATLRAENDRLLDEAYNARQSAKGENALRLEAEREGDEARAAVKVLDASLVASRLPRSLADEIATLRAEVERWVKEVAHLKLAAAERERMNSRTIATLRARLLELGDRPDGSGWSDARKEQEDE